MRAAEGHEKRVALREESAAFLEEKGDSVGAENERREADRERDAARNAWDRALALQGPTQTTEKGLEIPIPSREDFMANMRRVAAPATAPGPENGSTMEDSAPEA
jgi:hypothetical protein